MVELPTCDNKDRFNFEFINVFQGIIIMLASPITHRKQHANLLN